MDIQSGRPLFTACHKRLLVEPVSRMQAIAVSGDRPPSLFQGKGQENQHDALQYANY